MDVPWLIVCLFAEWPGKEFILDHNCVHFEMWMHLCVINPPVFFWLRKFGNYSVWGQDCHPDWNSPQSKFNQLPPHQIDVVWGLRENKNEPFRSFPFLVIKCGNESKELFGLEVENPAVVLKGFNKRQREKRRVKRRQQQQQLVCVSCQFSTASLWEDIGDPPLS